MKIVFMGVTHRSGIANKGQGKPYDMHKIHFATPIETIDTLNMSLTGYGFQEQTIDIDPLCLPQFHNVKPLTELDVIIEPKPSNFSQTWVVGFNPK